jgi:hypothetical protein
MTHERDPGDHQPDEIPDPAGSESPLSYEEFLAKHPDDRPDVDDDLIRLAEENSRGQDRLPARPRPPQNGQYWHPWLLRGEPAGVRPAAVQGAGTQAQGGRPHPEVLAETELDPAGWSSS